MNADNLGPPKKERPGGDQAARPNQQITNNTPNTHDNGSAAAVALLERGLNVFPADHPDHPECIGKHGTGTPCDGQRGKHPAVKWGVWAATVTPQMIKLAWAKHGGLANIAVACGPSNLVVLDEDEAGELERWCATYGITLPETYTVTTGRGRHLYFRWNHAVQRIGNSEKALKGFKINVRGYGGYAIAEGSRHESGAAYTGDGRPIADLPVEVASILLEGAGANGQNPLEGAKGQNPLEGAGEDPNTARIGFQHRHHALVAYAGRLRNSGLDHTEALPVFRERWLLCEQPDGQILEARFHSTACPYPVTWEEAQAKLRDVFTRYPAGHNLEEVVEVDHVIADDGAAGEDRDYWANAVRERAKVIRLDREARAIVDAEALLPVVYPPVTPLTELLEQPDEAVNYRIDQVAPKQGNIILAAQYKAGKTTLVNNLVRSLVDSDPFLGRFTVHQPAEHLVLIDDEMGRNTVRRWLREQKIVNTEAVSDVITLRGRVSTFNILNDKIRDHWATRLRDLGCDYLTLDCLRPILDALGLDENRDVGRFLVAFDALLADAGVLDSFVAQHMGHANERSRGDSRLQDWPDATWRIMREDDDPSSPRFFSAYGRDVDVYEGRLSFDAGTRRLTYAAGSRRDAKTEAAKIAVVQLLATKDAEPLSGRQIEFALALEHSRNEIRGGIAAAVKDGLVTVTAGQKQAMLHSINYPCSECGLPVASRRERHESCPSGPDDSGVQ